MMTVQKTKNVTLLLILFSLSYSQEQSIADMRGKPGGGYHHHNNGIDIPPPTVKGTIHNIDMGTEDDPRHKERIASVVNARMPGLRNVYNKYLKLKPGFSGKVTLKFTLTSSGDIVDISIVSSTTDYAEFDNAVKNMVATYKWKANDDNVTPTITFDFIKEE
jgi:TonB family protein